MTLPAINWPQNELIPVVIQDDESNAVLMMGYMNAESLERTRATGQVHFWSRSRQEIWHKGGGSGHVQHIRSMAINCDQNSLLIRVQQIGAVCHDGYDTCYYRDVLDSGDLAINRDRMFDPRDIYGDGFGLAALTRQWWGAYEWLKDNDLTHQSGTSSLLRDSDTSVIQRVRDELAELAGVLDGSHIHTNQEDDTVLEASQCCYWVVVEALKTGSTWTDVRPDRAIDVAEASVDAGTASAILRAEAMALTTMSSGVAAHLLQVIAEGARTVGVDPRRVIEADLDDLRSRDYLVPYFAR